MTDNMTDEEIIELKNEILDLKRYYAYAIPIKTKKIKKGKIKKILKNLRVIIKNRKFSSNY